MEAELEALKNENFNQALFNTSKAMFSPSSSSANKSATGNDEENYENFISMLKTITRLKQDKEEKWQGIDPAPFEGRSLLISSIETENQVDTIMMIEKHQ